MVHGLSWLYGSFGGEIELEERMNGLINTQMRNSLRISITLIFINVEIRFKLSPTFRVNSNKKVEYLIKMNEFFCYLFINLRIRTIF